MGGSHALCAQRQSSSPTHMYPKRTGLLRKAGNGQKQNDEAASQHKNVTPVMHPSCANESRPLLSTA